MSSQLSKSCICHGFWDCHTVIAKEAAKHSQTPDLLRVLQVNLVATQLVLDREHPNRIVFSPNRGLDPILDLRLRGAQVGCSADDYICKAISVLEVAICTTTDCLIGDGNK